VEVGIDVVALDPAVAEVPLDLPQHDQAEADAEDDE